MIVAKTTDPNGGKGGAVLSISEFMDTCELDRTTMFRLLKEGMPYRRTKSHIVIDFEKAREWISERGLGRPKSEEDISDIAARVKGFISAKIRENKPAVIAALFSLITVSGVGDSGAVTGPHLHYEVRIYSRGKEIAVNPLPYL